jgi:hypothetical protein
MKKFIAQLLLLTFLVIPMKPIMAMTEEEMSQQLSLLTTALAAIGMAISTSPELTEAESANLMNQLVAISDQILEIQATLSPIPPDILAEYEDADNTRTTVVDAKLNRITLRYDGTARHATATLEFATTTKQRTFTLVPPEGASYSAEIDLITKQVLDELASEFNIQRGGMAQLLRLSARDPIRDTNTVIAFNSSVAKEMAENFGKRSIVREIGVFPGKREGVIEFFSDQDESLRLSLKKNYDENNRFLGTYTYYVHYFVTSKADPYDTDSEGNPIPPKPKFELFAEDVTTNDIIEVTEIIISYIPFASSISNFDDKLVKFLTDNDTVYMHGAYSGPLTDAKRDCYYTSDKTALSEFLTYIVDGLEANYAENIVSNAKYVAPVTFDEYAIGGCEYKKRYF